MVVSSGWRTWVWMAALVLAAAYFALGVLWHTSETAAGLVAYDFYGQFYPWTTHAWRSIREGGGLLWNPYQDCGQPFFAIALNGLLYPVNLVFGVLDRDVALIASVILNLGIAGIGTFQLCRAMGLAGAPALCGALVFQLGWAATTLASWSPTHIGPLAWLPVAMWRAECLVRVPGRRNAILLAVALAIQLLPGFPQIVFFTYQLVVLRVAWALLLRQTGSARSLVLAAAAGLVVPVLLAAVRLLPALEGARESFRAGSLSADQLGAGFSWELLRRSLVSCLGIKGNAFVVLASVLGIAGATRQRRWEHAGFWALVAVVYFVLSLGPGSFLFDLYEHLPLGMAFRGPARLLWVVSFALAVLAGLGAEVLLGRGEERPAWWSGVLVACVVIGALALHVLSATGLRPVDVLMAAGLLVAAVAGGRPYLGRVLCVALPLLVFVNYAIGGLPPFFGLRKGDVYAEHAEVFAFVSQRLTPQDRVLIVGGHPDLGLMPKSATLFRVPSIHDYEALAPRTYVEFFTFMRTGRRMRGNDDWYWLFGKLLPDSLERPLFDLTAARYVIVKESLDRTGRALGPDVHLLLDDGGVRVYENERALARARYVPRIAVTPEDQALPALAAGRVDPSRAAVVSRPPRSGFTGSGADASGSVEFVADEPERVVLRVRASAPGFLFLADQYAPGWRVTVDGREAEILRANHTFRLVEVPAGNSEVVFTYRPVSLLIGAAISLATAVFIVVLWRRRDRNPG